MTIYATPIDLKQAACVEADVNPIVSESQGGRKATKLNIRYEPIVRELLTKHAWSFATASVPLVFQAENTTGNAGPWRYIYDEPEPNPAKLNNRGVHLAHPADNLSDYQRQVPHELYNGSILTNCKFSSAEGESRLVLVYTFRADEGDWPADFAEGVVKRLGAVVAVDRQKRVELEQESALYISRAIAREREQFPRDRPGDTQLIDAWECGWHERY